MTTLELVSRHLHMKKNDLLNEGVLAFLEKKKRMILLERISALEKYGVDSKEEIEKKIGKGLIPDHPAWEDVIALENIEEELTVIENDIRKVHKTI